MFVNATPRFSHETRGMAVVVVHHSAVLVREVTDLIELGNGTIHRKNAVGCNEDATSPTVPSSNELRFKVCHVVISIAKARGFAQTDAIDN